MKPLLIVTALVEAAAGLALLGIPAATILLLLGVRLESPGALVAGRIAGAALFALALACWQARNAEAGPAVKGVISAALFYNLGAVAILLNAGLRLKMHGVALWPAVVAHQGLAVWCLASLSINRRNLSKKEI